MKAPLRLLFVALCLLVCTLAAAASEPEVNSYDITCQIDKKGLQSWTLDLSMALPQDCTRLEIPLPGEADHVKVSGFRHKLETADEGQTVLVVTDSKGFAAAQTFRITWQSRLDLTEGPITSLNLLLLSSYCPWQVRSLTYSVSLPAAPITEGILCQSGYYGDLDTEVCSLVLSGSQVYGTVQEGFLAYDSFTLHLDLPEDAFTAPGRFVRYLTSAAGVLELLSLAVLIAALFFWSRRCRIGTLRIRTRTSPPDGITAEALPYVLWSSRPHLGALILQWAAAGYLTVYVREGRVILRRRMAMGNERQDHEQQLYRLLFSQSELCQLPDPDLTRAVGRLSKGIKKSWHRQFFAPGKPQAEKLKLLTAAGMALCTAALLQALLPQGWGWTLVSLLGSLPGFVWGLYLQYTAGQLLLLPAGSRSRQVEALVLSGLVGLFGLGRGVWMLLPMSLLQCFVGLQTLFGEKRTSEGREALVQVLGLRRYFMTVTREELRTALRQDPMFFYRMLPWAQALGLGGSFSRRFGTLPLEAADWYPAACSDLTAARFYESLSPVLDQLWH